jgi:hypothetical protein
MSAAKKQNSPTGSAWPRRAVAWLLGPGRSALALLVLIGLFLGGWYYTWQYVKDRVLTSPERGVGPEQMEVTQRPPWIRSDVRDEVFRLLRSSGPLNILDDALVQRVKNAFASHPWVARVRSVGKQSPAIVKVEVDYRQPVCAVAVPNGLLLVDAEGVLLPSGDFTPSEAGRYPRLVGVDRPPDGPAGRRWNDARVIGGAEIAAALGPVWNGLKLQRIVPLRPALADNGLPGGARDPAEGRATEAAGAGQHVARTPPPDSGSGGLRSAAERRGSRLPGEYLFGLVTVGNTEVYWGYPPGAVNILGEFSAAEKIAGMQQYAAEHDSLDDPRGPRKLDVRTLCRRDR